MLTAISIGKNCNGCTKCCDGILIGEAYGQKFGYGLGCSFKDKKGCMIYENRPYNPCKTFLCEWKTNSSIPEWLKPDKSDIIILRKQVDEFTFLRFVSLNEIDNKIYDWAKEFIQSHTDANIIIPYKNGFKVYSNYLKFIEFIKQDSTVYE